MADVFSKEKRSEIMKGVKPSGNKTTELKLIDYFSSNHITGWRRHYDVKGHPDFVFLDRRIAIFVDGCFGTGTTAETLAQLKTLIIGAKKEKRILNMIRLLRSSLKEGAGRLSAYGNAN